MARESQEVLIEGKEYLIHQLRPQEAQNLILRIIKLFGPSLSKLAKMFEGNTSNQSDDDNSNHLDKTIDLDILTEALVIFSDRLDPKGGEQLIADLLKVVEVKMDGGGFVPIKNRIELDYAGETFLLFRIAFESAKVNFADFLPGILTGFQGGLLKKQNEPKQKI